MLETVVSCAATVHVGTGSADQFVATVAIVVPCMLWRRSADRFEVASDFERGVERRRILFQYSQAD
jgi:hypothetical protein